MNKKKGFTLAELIVYIAIFAIVMSFVATLNISGSQLFRAGNASVDIQEDLNRAILQLQTDILESDPRGMAVRYTTALGTAAEYPHPGVTNTNFNFAVPESQATPQITTAIIMLSPRQLKVDNAFSPYLWDNNAWPAAPTCGGTTEPGPPCWRNWVCYFLSPNPATAAAGTNFALERVEFPINATVTAGGSSLPTTNPGMPPGGWEAFARGLTTEEAKITLSTNIDQFAITNPITGTVAVICPSPPCLYQNPYNFDASLSSKSVVEFAGLPQFWINIEGSEYPAIFNNKARNYVQVFTRN